jgi:hypothetical protein
MSKNPVSSRAVSTEGGTAGGAAVRFFGGIGAGFLL